MYVLAMPEQVRRGRDFDSNRQSLGRLERSRALLGFDGHDREDEAYGASS